MMEPVRRITSGERRPDKASHSHRTRKISRFIRKQVYLACPPICTTDCAPPEGGSTTPPERERGKIIENVEAEFYFPLQSLHRR